MEQRTLVVSRFYRLKMSEELAKVIRSLPVRIEKEVRDRDCVYRGLGTLKLSGRGHEAEMAVLLEEGGLVARMDAPSAGLRIDGPFETEEDRAEFLREVREAVAALMD